MPPQTIPHFNPDDCVLFRADPGEPPRQFRVVSRQWNEIVGGWEYHIRDENTGKGFQTVGEDSLSACPPLRQ